MSADRGCFCQSCGSSYRVDLRVDDELWARIHGDKSLLCPVCIAERIENLGEFAYYDLKLPRD